MKSSLNSHMNTKQRHSFQGLQIRLQDCLLESVNCLGSLQFTLEVKSDPNKIAEYIFYTHWVYKDQATFLKYILFFLFTEKHVLWLLVNGHFIAVFLIFCSVAVFPQLWEWCSIVESKTCVSLRYSATTDTKEFQAVECESTAPRCTTHQLNKDMYIHTDEAVVSRHQTCLTFRCCGVV